MLQHDASYICLYAKDEQIGGFALKGKIEIPSLASFLEFSSSGEAILVGLSGPKKSIPGMDHEYSIKCFHCDTQT
jgi:hypothetical protein